MFRLGRFQTCRDSSSLPIAVGEHAYEGFVTKFRVAVRFRSAKAKDRRGWGCYTPTRFRPGAADQLLNGECGVATIFRNVAIIECSDADHLQQLIAAGLERFVVRTLGDCAVQVDHERLPAIKKLLERLGETPRLAVG